MADQTTPQHSGTDTNRDGIRLGFLGPVGTFTEQAAHNFVRAGHVARAYAAGAGAATAEGDVTLVPFDSPGEVLGSLRAGEIDYACVALESSVDGPVSQTEDALATGSPLQVFYETLVPITFSILVRPGTQLEDIRTFSSHPIAEAQVRQWLRENIPQARFVAASSNGAAARHVAEGAVDAAAAPARAGELFGLDALAAGVADVDNAFTRFILVGHPATPTPRTGHDRTGLILTLENRPASLLDALAELSTRGVDMFRISSRPLRRDGGVMMGTYVFNIGITGHIDDAAVAEALAGLYRSVREVRYLGSWPGDFEPVHAAGGFAMGLAPSSYAASHAWIEALKEGKRT